MHPFILIVTLGTCLMLLQGQAAGAVLSGQGGLVSRSRSGQFIIRADPSALNAPLSAEQRTNTTLVELDPTLLAVSAERIKETLLLQLGDLGPWRGKIYLFVYPARTVADLPVITAELFQDGWQYQVTFPSLISSSRYVSAIVQVLLLEYANRHPGQKAAEIPSWLAAGLTAELLATREVELVLKPPRDMRAGIPTGSTFREARRSHPLTESHRVLQQTPPLTFEELSWPDPAVETSIDPVYRSSAHLLVSRLLALPKGPTRLRGMIAELPNHQNWQFAFLRAFDFQRILDAEKWWALQTVHFSSRTIEDTWRPETGRQKLDAALQVEVMVWGTTNDLPRVAQTNLQSVVSTMQPDLASQMVEKKILELRALQLRLSPDLTPVADGYILGLSWIVQALAVQPRPTRQIVDRAVALLDALDKARLSGQALSQKDIPPRVPTRPAGMNPSNNKLLENNSLRQGI